MSALYFYHSKAFYCDCSLRGGDCPLRVQLISLVCLCVNQWYMTTVFLTIVFVGARCVFNEREGRDDRCILGLGKDLF